MLWVHCIWVSVALPAQAGLTRWCGGDLNVPQGIEAFDSNVASRTQGRLRAMSRGGTGNGPTQ